MIEQNPQILSEKRAVGLVCNPSRKEIGRIAERIAQQLVSNNLTIQADSGSFHMVDDKIELIAIEDMDADFVITIGGDGTILYTLSRLKDRSTPLFCINRGTVGFLTESGTTTAFSSLEKVLANECIIESNVNISSGIGEKIFPDALNEVYIVSRIPGRLLTMQIYLDNVRIDYGRADGAMLATPCGSTAYALAAGGSILAPDVNGLIFVPVCSPRFELKAVVIPDHSTLEIELVKSGAPGLAVIDGQTRWDVEAHEKVWLKKSEHISRFIRLYDNYYDRLNTRLIPRTL